MAKNTAQNSIFSQVPFWAGVAGVGATLILIAMVFAKTFFFPNLQSSVPAAPIADTSVLINDKPLFEQIQESGFKEAIISIEPAVITPESVPANWETTEDGDTLGFQLRYPPDWSYHGKGRFCMNPFPNGSCQDSYPYYFELTEEYQQNKKFLEYMQSLLNLESTRLREIGFKYDLIFSKLEFGKLDGLVVRQSRSDHSDPTIPSESSETIFINIDGRIRVFLMDIDDPVQKKVFSSLREI